MYWPLIKVHDGICTNSLLLTPENENTFKNILYGDIIVTLLKHSLVNNNMHFMGKSYKWQLFHNCTFPLCMQLCSAIRCLIHAILLTQLRWHLLSSFNGYHFMQNDSYSRHIHKITSKFKKGSIFDFCNSPFGKKIIITKKLLLQTVAINATKQICVLWKKKIQKYSTYSFFKKRLSYHATYMIYKYSYLPSRK